MVLALGMETFGESKHCSLIAWWLIGYQGRIRAMYQEHCLDVSLWVGSKYIKAIGFETL